ncbi:tyrosine-type recombinase/integrase [Enterococcus faecium]|uniref:tyrosine-type recombinase/integrase n=1 Tax=Enterococcus faecium TaxID=1352 RepID=UPI0020733C65|nr:site-specific integrase [Enterococcus faecium]MCM6878413.1 site-specific integrase [Enterococcus faecium]
MSIIKMKTGKFKINVYMGEGNSRYIAYADTKQEAEILEAEANLRKLKGKAKTKKGDYTFEEVYQEWWKKKYTVTKHHEQSTLNGTKSVFRLQILPYLAKKKIKKITYNDLEELQILWAFGDEEKGVKPYANFKKNIAYTKQVFRYAMIKGYIATNPFELLDMPVNETLKRNKEEKRRKKYYSAETIQKSLQLIKNEYGVMAYTLLALTYYLGATKGEIYPLVWADVDFQNENITMNHKLVKNAATGKRERVSGMKNDYRYRTVPINHSIVKLLKEWQVLQVEELKQVNIIPTAEQFLFTYTTQKGELNQPLHPDWLNNKLNALEKKYGLPHIIPHGLRHTFVSDLLNQGYDELVVKSLVGHAETSNITREIYGHANIAKQIEAVNLLEEIREREFKKA